VECVGIEDYGDVVRRIVGGGRDTIGRGLSRKTGTERLYQCVLARGGWEKVRRSGRREGKRRHVSLVIGTMTQRTEKR